MHRPIPKSKILETLKKRDDSSLLSISNAPNETVRASPNVIHQSPWARKTTASIVSTAATTTTATATISAKPNQSRKSLCLKKTNEKPTNTIRSMFAKQVEKSRIENSQLNGTLSGTLNEMATLNINDSLAVDEVVETPKEESTIVENKDEMCLVTGTLHKRLTRRNSMLMQTPTKSIPEAEKITEVSSTRSSAKKRRCTMFAPSFRDSIDEEDTKNTDAIEKDAHDDKNKTNNKTLAMEICNESNKTTTKCNSKVRELLNSELSKTPHGNGLNGTKVAAVKSVEPKTNLRRRTTYTPQVMEETQVQNTFITPISTNRRKTMNVNAAAARPLNTPKSIEKKSCDDISTPTNSVASKFSHHFSVCVCRNIANNSIIIILSFLSVFRTK